MFAKIIQKIESKKILIIIAGIVVVIACLNINRKLSLEIPDDGITWKLTAEGFLKAERLILSYKTYVSIKEGDILLSIQGQRVRSIPEFTKALWQYKPNDLVKYIVKRGNQINEVEVSIVRKKIFFYVYLCIVGFAVLAFGIFILLKGKNEKLVRAFFYNMLLLFTIYTISHVGTFDKWDWILYWIDEIALLALPLCFIASKKLLLIPVLLIVIKLFLLAAGLVGIFDVNDRMYAVVYNYSEKVDLLYLLSGIAIGIILLIISFRRSQDIVQRNQLKLILAGLGAGFGLFIIFGILYLCAELPMKVLELSTLTQIFIPVAFTYSLLKYKLMDVDIIIKRGIIYTMTTIVVIAIYVGVMLGSLYVFGKGSKASLVLSGTISTVLAFLVFSPLRQRIKDLINKQYYKDSYNYREMLGSLLKSVSRQPNIMELSKELIPMISYTFQVNKIAFYIRKDDCLELLNGIDLEGNNNLIKVITLSTDEFLFLNSHNRIDLNEKKLLNLNYNFINYYLEKKFSYLYPCIYKNNVNGLIAVSNKKSSELLTSEDESLLMYVANDFAIAIEVSRLVYELSKKANELERMKNFNEGVVESLNVCIVSYDNDLKITFCNDCFSNVFGLTKEKVINKNLKDILPIKLFNSIIELHQGFIEGKDSSLQPQLYKIHLPINDKELIVNMSIVRMKTDRYEGGGNILILEDMTKQAYLEAQLNHAERLSSVGLMAAGIAHEVNTPLTGIASYAEMLSKEIKERRAKNILMKIQEQAFRASNIVSNLLNLSRRQSLTTVIIDLHDVIDNSIKLLKPHFKDTNIVIKKDFQIDNFIIKGNEAKLQQLIINLLLNARDAMNNGGKIIIKTWQEGEFNYFSIEDGGKGIPESIQDKIFDPFFTTKSLSKGTGLGLSLCYNIAKEHFGMITFKSKEGEGTTFIVSFPIERLQHDRKGAFVNN